MTNYQTNYHNNSILKQINNELPHKAIEFDKIKEADFISALKCSIELTKDRLSAIKREARPDFANTIEALEFSTEEFSFVSSLFSNYSVACTNDDIQKMAEEFYPMAAALKNDIFLDLELFKQVKTVKESVSLKTLSVEQQKLLTETFDQFVLNGALLDEKQKTELRDIDSELAKLSPEFAKNCLKFVNQYELKVTREEDLKGLPKSSMDAAKELADKKGYKNTWVFKLQGPSYIPFLKYCENRKLREEFFTQYALANSYGEFDNSEIVLKTVKLRKLRAELLGFKTHADLTLNKRMAETPQRVKEFLAKLLKQSKNAALRDVAEVQELAKSMDSIDKIMPWDFAFYSEKLKVKKFDFDEESVRPYFQLEKVVEGTFAVANKLYGLTFTPAQNYPVYHPEVKVYEVNDRSGFIGLFYCDFFPRDSKNGGAWMTNYRDQGVFQKQVIRPHVGIVCNFSRPTGNEPSLLSFDEVRTLFHEFGHALHGLLSNCNYRSLAGPNVYWDFVELPSQIMENWALEEETLKLFAFHYKTGEPIPMDLVKKIEASSKFQSGYMCVRQLTFAALDLAWHSHPNPESIADINKFEDETLAEYRVLPKISGSNTSTGFRHIFSGGYDAGYYSYKWAEVLDADAFEYFKEKGLFNTEVASKFRNEILARGGCEHPAVLYKRFRGRDPDTQALLRRDGLI